MKFKELVDLIDYERDGRAWITICDNQGYPECKINTASLFIIDFYEYEIEHIEAWEPNEFKFILKGPKEERNEQNEKD